MIDLMKSIACNIEERKKIKKYLEAVITLSNEGKEKVCFNSYVQGNKMRLIDEGAILYSDGQVRFWIKKGTIQKFYDSLPNDYVGYVNLGHIDLASVPLVLGSWTKSDLEVVDLEDGRQGLDCTPHIDYDLNIVQDLMKQNIPLSISIEFNYKPDDEQSEKMGFPVIDEINILGFSIVGDPANVSSSNVNLGGCSMTLKEILEKFKAEEELNDDTDMETVDEQETSEEQTEEASEETVEEKENEVSDYETSDEDSNETKESSNEVEEEILRNISELHEKVEVLESKNSDLEQTLKSKELELEEKKKQLDEFFNRFQNVLGKEKQKKKTKIGFENL